MAALHHPLEFGAHLILISTASALLAHGISKCTRYKVPLRPQVHILSVMVSRFVATVFLAIATNMSREARLMTAMFVLIAVQSIIVCKFDRRNQRTLEQCILAGVTHLTAMMMFSLLGLVISSKFSYRLPF